MVSPSWTEIKVATDTWRRFLLMNKFEEIHRNDDERQTLTTRHIHNWASFLLWPSCLILSGAVSNCPLLSLVVYQNLPTWVRREFIFQCHFFLPYHTKEQEELKSLLMRVKESVKAGLKLNIQKTKIIVSDPITSWQMDGETMQTVADFILGLQNHCRWWLQPWN